MIDKVYHVHTPMCSPQEPSSIEKIMEIDEHMGCAMSGLTADAKTLIDHARAETQVQRLTIFVVFKECTAE